jgi:hypothetical protein
MSSPRIRSGSVVARAAACIAVAVAALLPAAAAAQPAAVSPIPLFDSVTATGSGAGFVDLQVSAQSGPSGENPTGTASTTVEVDLGPPGPGFVTLSGPVTCLAVSGTTAVLNFTDQTLGLGSLTLQLTDNGGGGQDLVAAGAQRRAPTDCSPLTTPPQQLTAGRVVVVDAQPPPTSKQQCKHKGYLQFGFKTRRDCFRFVRHHR